MIDPELDREYSPSSMVDDIGVFLDAYRVGGEQARRTLPHVTLSYGRHPNDLVDLFPAASRAPLLHVFIHGGYWQQLSRHDGSLLAPGVVSAGHHFASVDYTLCPAAPLPGLVDQVMRCIKFLRTHVCDMHGEPIPLVVSGHSAGAHLAAMAALRCAPGTIDGLVLISGVYDLVPLLQTSVNDAVGLDEATALRMSPLALSMARSAGPDTAAAHPIDTVVVVGEIETDTFKSQSQAFTEAWSAAGHPATFSEIADRNHFDIVADVADRSAPLGALVHDQQRRLLRPPLS